MSSLFRIFIITILGLNLIACSQFRFPGVYRINIPQGNVIEPKKVEQLTIGMSEEQVKYLLGTPIIHDTFQPNRWDYIYYLKTAKNQVIKNRLTLLFNDGQLTNIDKGKIEIEDKDGASLLNHNAVNNTDEAEDSKTE